MRYIFIFLLFAFNCQVCVAFDLVNVSIQSIKPFDKFQEHAKKFEKIDKNPFGIDGTVYGSSLKGVRLWYSARFDNESKLCVAAGETYEYEQSEFNIDYQNNKIKKTDFVKSGPPDSMANWRNSVGDKGNSYCWGDCKRLQMSSYCDACSGEFVECSQGDCLLISIFAHNSGTRGQVKRSFQVGENVRKNSQLLEEMNRQVLASRKPEREKLFEIYADDGESFRGNCGGNSFAGTYSKSSSTFTVTGPKGVVYDRSKQVAIQRACR